MAIERWFYHKFHHGLTLADVERYTHLLVNLDPMALRSRQKRQLPEGPQ